MSAMEPHQRTNMLIDELLRDASEQPCVEFKANNSHPEIIGRLISALSNAACLFEKNCAYILWGINDDPHEIVGTDFNPDHDSHERQPISFWLAQRLNPSVNFVFEIVHYNDKRLVLLTIPAAQRLAVEFNRIPYIRIGSATPPLSDYPDRQQTLWSKLQSSAWEQGLAKHFVHGDAVVDCIDHVRYFEMTGQPIPDNRARIFERLQADKLIRRDVAGRWDITNLGAILFAKRLADFPNSIARKAIRFVAYGGTSRADQVTHRKDIDHGYAAAFPAIVEYINGLLPINEHIGKALREEHPLYPAIAIRELIANALIHQDMSITGTGPLIELFSDRLEISNPGKPLVSPDRFLDAAPRSRNEALASLMRRMKLCEEQGTGVDKVIFSIEFHQMPPPNFREEGEAVRVTLYAPRRFAEMTPEERIRACFQHASLRYVSGQRMKNASLCDRFGIEPQNAAQASNVIRQAQEAGLIRPADPDKPRSGYVPFWA